MPTMTLIKIPDVQITGTIDELVQVLSMLGRPATSHTPPRRGRPPAWEKTIRHAMTKFPASFTVKEALQLMRANTPDHLTFNDSSVGRVLTNLAKIGYLRREREGKSYRYWKQQ